MRDRPALLLVVGAVAMAVVMVGLVIAFPPVGSPQSPLVVPSLGIPPQKLNPGGPLLKLTVQDVGADPIVQLAATLYLQAPFVIEFLNVTQSSPLILGQVASSSENMVGPWVYSCGSSYLLEFLGTYSGGATFDERVGALFTCPPGW
jgi:hypothetical protein